MIVVILPQVTLGSSNDAPGCRQERKKSKETERLSVWQSCFKLCKGVALFASTP